MKKAENFILNFILKVHQMHYFLVNFTTIFTEKGDFTSLSNLQWINFLIPIFIFFMMNY